MPQLLHQVYANVRDFDAKGNGRDDDTAFIQAAIDNKEGHHVLFPRGELEPSGEINPYKILGHLKFQNDGQRCIFLAGASLELDSDYASVIISGKSQTLTGLWITVGTASYGPHSGSTAVPDPCLLIDGADDLLLEDLHVGCSSAGTLVRIRNAEGVTIRGGRLTGVNELKENTGLDIGSGARNVSALHLTMDQLGYGVVLQDNTGAYEVGAIGLTVKAFGWGVRIGCITDDPSFVRCIFTNNVDGALIVRDDADMVPESGAGVYYQTLTVAKALTMIGCHMDGAVAPAYVHVQGGEVGEDDVVYGGGAIAGGAILGCTFGNRRLDADEDVAAQVLAAGAIAPRAAMRTPAGTARLVGVGQRRGVDGARSASGRSPGGSNSQSAPTRSKGANSGRLAVSSTSGKGGTLGVLDMGLGGSDRSRDACIFLIEGYVNGVLVSGCRSEYRQDRRYVWSVSDSAQVTNSCDLFNAWSEPTVATGHHASSLVRMTTDGAGRLTLVAGALRLKASKLGFFGAEPGEPGGAYTTPTAGGFELHPGNVHLVLANLLLDLGRLGLIPLV